MHPDQPPPDDARYGQLARVEDRLKRLQPSPLELTAEAVLRAADPAPQVAGRWERWLTIAASAAGGAVAGAVLTMLLLSRDGEPTASAPRNPDEQPTGRPTVDRVATDQSPSPELGESAAVPPDSSPMQPRRWTNAELLISNHFLEPHGLHPSARHASPLRAGSALRQFAKTFAPHDESLAVIAAESRPDRPAEDGTSPAKSSALPVMERDQLLREILGSQRRSAL